MTRRQDILQRRCYLYRKRRDVYGDELLVAMFAGAVLGGAIAGLPGAIIGMMVGVLIVYSYT